MTTVGTSKYRYKLIEDWAKLPQGESLGSPMSVATDSQDRVYVFQRNKQPPVLVFDRSGNYLSSWGIGAFAGPHLLYIKDDIVYLADRDDHVVLRYTLDGKPIQVIGNRGVPSDTGIGPDFDDENEVVPKAAGPFNYPSKVVPSPSGDLFVSDGYRNARVHKFAGDGHLIASWGEPGKTRPYQMQLVHSLLLHDGRVYVCDRENHRIQIFSLDGKYLTMWTDVRRPTDIAVDRDGTFYVSEVYVERDALGPMAKLPKGEHRVSVLDGQGKVLARWEARLAHGLWVDPHGDIYLACPNDRTVDKYVRQR